MISEDILKKAVNSILLVDFSLAKTDYKKNLPKDVQKDLTELAKKQGVTGSTSDLESKISLWGSYHGEFNDLILTDPALTLVISGVCCGNIPRSPVSPGRITNLASPENIASSALTTSTCIVFAIVYLWILFKWDNKNAITKCFWLFR